MPSERVRDLYYELVNAHIEPVLLKHGFSQSPKEWFYRFEGDAVWRVATTLTKVRGQDEGWVLVGLCVGFRSLWKFMAGCPRIRSGTARKPCMMATDLGHLRPPYQYHEWRLLGDTDMDALGNEIASDIEQYGLPYFERHGTLEKALAAWEGGIVYSSDDFSIDCYRAAVYWMKGDRQRAVELIQSRIAEYDKAWHQKQLYSDLNRRDDFKKFLAFLEAKAEAEV